MERYCATVLFTRLANWPTLRVRLVGSFATRVLSCPLPNHICQRFASANLRLVYCRVFRPIASTDTKRRLMWSTVLSTRLHASTSAKCITRRLNSADAFGQRGVSLPCACAGTHTLVHALTYIRVLWIVRLRHVFLMFQTNLVYLCIFGYTFWVIFLCDPLLGFEIQPFHYCFHVRKMEDNCLDVAVKTLLGWYISFDDNPVRPCWVSRRLSFWSTVYPQRASDRTWLAEVLSAAHEWWCALILERQ